MPQLRFITSLCLPISLICGQIVSTNVTYASYEQESFYDTFINHLKPKADSDEDIEMEELVDSDDDQDEYVDIERAKQRASSSTRQRFKGKSAEVAKDQEDDKKAERKLQLAALRKENKDHLDDFVKYGMLGIFLTASTNMLWNIEHSPEPINASWTYTEEEWMDLVGQQNTFTNSGAFSTLQYTVAGLTVASLGKSIHALWQIKDSLPSSTELKIKGKSLTWDAWWLGVNGIVSTGFKGLPTLWKFAKQSLTQSEDIAHFRPIQGSTNKSKLSRAQLLLGSWFALFGGAELSLTHWCFKPASQEFQRYASNPPEEFKAKKLVLNLSGLKLGTQDFSFFVTLNNITELYLRNCSLTDKHAEILYLFGSSSLEKLDIRENPRIPFSALRETIGWSVTTQNVRRILGFRNLKTLLFDAPEGLINQEELFLTLRFSQRRKLKVSGVLTRKDELKDFYDRNFYYFKKTTLNDFLPPEIEEIIEQSKDGSQPKESFQVFHKESNHQKKLGVTLERYQDSFQNDEEILRLIYSMPYRNKKNVCFLVEPGLGNQLVLYTAKQDSSRPKDYIITPKRTYIKDPREFERTHEKFLIEQINYWRSINKDFAYNLLHISEAF